MPFEEGLTFNQRSAVANADLSAKQFFAVSFASGGKLDVATAAKNIDGILQNNPKINKAATYVVSGPGVITKAAISASQSVTAGVTLFEVDSAGTLKVLASGTAVARARESLTSVAAVRILAVELLPSNAAFT